MTKGSFNPLYKKLEARQVFVLNLNDKVSQEEHKTIYSGLRISGMALSDQSDLLAFSVPGKSIKNRRNPRR